MKFIKPFYQKINVWLVAWDRFLMDWSGDDARPGRDRVPGVMERLNNIDGELQRNGGKSVKDTVNRIERRLIEGDKKFNNLELRTKVLEDRLGA